MVFPYNTVIGCCCSSVKSSNAAASIEFYGTGSVTDMNKFYPYDWIAVCKAIPF